MDFTYVRTWAGFVYIAFVLDVFAQKIVAWNVAPTKAVELVDVPVADGDCGSADAKATRSCAVS